MEDIKVPIYLITGFLESGKTTFLDFTLQQEYFSIDGKTLLILCEEGEEEYDKEKLKSGCYGYYPSAGPCGYRIQWNVACEQI